MFVHKGTRHSLCRDVLKVDSKTIVVFQRFVTPPDAVPIIEPGITKVIFAKGPLPMSPTSPISKHSFKGITDVCFADADCPELNPPVLLSDIPDLHAAEATPYQHNMGPYFQATDPSQLPLTFKLEGLPERSSMRFFTDSGIFTGIPERVDSLNSPMKLTVTAIDAYGSEVSAEFGFVVLGDKCQAATNCTHCLELNCYFIEGGVCTDKCIGYGTTPCIYNAAFCPVAPRLLASIPDMDAKRGIQFRYDAAAHFQEDTPIFEIKGLPKYDSGLSMDRETGIISGFPTAVDLLASPLNITVTARNTFMEGSSTSFTLTITPSDYCSKNDECGPKAYCDYSTNLCTSYIAAGQACVEGGVRCPPNFACKDAVCSIVDCQASYICEECTTYGCKFTAGIGCGDTCLGDANCASSPFECAANLAPTIISPIPAQNAISGRDFKTSFAQYFNDPDGQPLMYQITGLMNTTVNTCFLHRENICFSTLYFTGIY